MKEKINLVVIGILIIAVFLLLGYVFTFSGNENKTDIDLLRERVKIELEKNKQLEMKALDYKTNIINLEDSLRDKELLLQDSKDEYDQKIKQIKKFNQKQIKEYIHNDSGGDSTVLAIHLEERIKCLRENEVLISMNSDLKGIIVNKNSILQIDSLQKSNLESSIKMMNIGLDRLEKENKKATKALKRQKILSRILIVVVIAESIVILLNQ